MQDFPVAAMIHDICVIGAYEENEEGAQAAGYLCGTDFSHYQAGMLIIAGIRERGTRNE